MWRAEVAASPDPVAQPARAFVRGVGKQQDHQGRGAEQHEGVELVLLSQGHVGDEDHGQQKHTVDRTVVPEDVIRRGLGGAPGHDPENETEVPYLQGRDLVPPGQVEVGLGHRVGGSVEPANQARIGVRQRGTNGLYHDEGPDDAAERVGQPRRQSEPSTHVTPQRRGQGDPHEEARKLVLPHDPARVGDGPGHRSGQEQDQRQAGPAFLRTHAFEDPANPSMLLGQGGVALGPVDLGALGHKRADRCHRRPRPPVRHVVACRRFMPAPSRDCRRRGPRRPSRRSRRGRTAAPAVRARPDPRPIRRYRATVRASRSWRH